MHILVCGTEVLVSHIACMAMNSLVSAIENTQCVWYTPCRAVLLCIHSPTEDTVFSVQVCGTEILVSHIAAWQ